MQPVGDAIEATAPGIAATVPLNRLAL